MSNAQEAIGRRTLMAVATGCALSAAYMEQEPAVRRGDQVVLAVTKGNLTVSVNTRAQEDGLLGDVVRLKEARGRGDYLATVTGPARATPLSGGER
jgi:flagella basal body P-ring formation protein FlgA